MIETSFRLNGKPIVSPNNHQELEIELQFSKDSVDYRGQVSTNVWQLGLGDKNNTQDGTKEALKYINDGLIGGTGVFEGVSFKIDLHNGNDKQVLFDGYLDLSDAEITCSSIKAKAIESGGVDWLNDVADSFTFEYLVSEGVITRADYVNVPYFISEIPDYTQGAIIGISLFTVVQEFLDQMQDLLGEPLKTLFANPAHIAAFVIRIITIIILVISIVLLIIQLIKTFLQVVKFHSAMYLFTLCEKGAAHLGLEFKSDTILETADWRKVVILPETYEQFDNDTTGINNRIIEFSKNVIGYLTASDVDGNGFYRGTYGNLLRALKDMFNAKIILKGDGILRLERLDYDDAQSNYQLPDVDLRNTPYKFNADELFSNYTISFLSDSNDKQALNNWKGTETQILTVPKNVTNKLNLINKGSKNISIPFSRGKRNTKINFLERMASEYIKFIVPIVHQNDRLIQILSTTANLLVFQSKKFLKAIRLVSSSTAVVPVIPPIPPVTLSRNVAGLQDYVFRRSDALIMSSDFITVPKLVMMEEDYETFNDIALDVVKLNLRNDEVVNSLNIYNEFHTTNSFVGANNNQHKIYEIDTIPFCIDDYNQVKGNNKIKDASGNSAEIISLKWNVYKQTASVKYKTKFTYTDNLKEIIIESDGR